MALPAPSNLLRVFSSFEAAVNDSGSSNYCPETLGAITALKNAIDMEFESSGTGSSKRYCSTEERAERRRLFLALSYQKRKCISLEKQLAGLSYGRANGLSNSNSVVCEVPPLSLHSNTLLHCQCGSDADRPSLPCFF